MFQGSLKWSLTSSRWKTMGNTGTFHRSCLPNAAWIHFNSQIWFAKHCQTCPIPNRVAVEGKARGIRFCNYKEMFQKMEETFRFCTGCSKLPEHLPEGQALKRCVKWVQSHGWRIAPHDYCQGVLMHAWWCATAVFRHQVQSTLSSLWTFRGDSDLLSVPQSVLLAPQSEHCFGTLVQ